MIGIAQAVKADDIRMFPPAGNSPTLLEIRTIVLQFPLPQFHLLKDLECTLMRIVSLCARIPALARSFLMCCLPHCGDHIVTIDPTQILRRYRLSQLSSRDTYST